MKPEASERSDRKKVNTTGRALLKLFWPKNRAKRENALYWSSTFSAFNLAAFAAVGFLCGWTWVQDGTAVGSAAAAILSVLILEVLRTLLAGALSRKFGAWKAGIPTAVLFAAAEILLQTGLPDMSSAQAVMSLLFEGILPALCTSVLMTAFVIRGGLASTLFYRIFSLLISFLPYQPYETRFGSLFLHVILPLFFIIALDLDWSGGAQEEKKAADDAGGAGSDPAAQEQKKKGRFRPARIIPVVILMALMAFLAGLLPCYPAVIATGSMEPALAVGDVVIISKPDGNDPQVGDILAFEKDGALVIHRLAEIREEDAQTVYITKGDANNADDAGYITAEDISGKVIFTIPAIGWLSLWFHQTAGT